MMDWHHLLHHFRMSERLDLADAACPARFQPNFQGGEAKGEDRPENAGLKTRDAPIRADAARQDERSEVRAPIRLLCDIEAV